MNILSSTIWPSDMPDDRRVIALLGLVQISEEGMGDWLEVLEELAESNVSYGGFIRAGLDTMEDMAGEIERLNALVSMQSEALQAQPNFTREVWKDGIDIDVPVYYTQKKLDALSATAETVSAWQLARDNEIRAKALEDAAKVMQHRRFELPSDAHDELIELASELRAKGE